MPALRGRAVRRARHRGRDAWDAERAARPHRGLALPARRRLRRAPVLRRQVRNGIPDADHPRWFWHLVARGPHHAHHRPVPGQGRAPRDRMVSNTPAAPREYDVHARSTATFGRVLCSARTHHFIIDGPVANGCPGEALTPPESFLSWVAACAVELVQVVARAQSVPERDVSV